MLSSHQIAIINDAVEKVTADYPGEELDVNLEEILVFSKDGSGHLASFDIFNFEYTFQ